MRILALDLATHTGWATNHSGKVEVGTLTLATPKEIKLWGKTRLTRRQDPRIVRLRDWIAPFCGQLDYIVYEDILFASSTLQVQLWASLRAAVWLACKECNIRYEAVPVQTLKKSATGKGNADKTAMLFTARTLRPDLKFDADSADAFHLWTWAQKHIRI